jgi:hypothetical protein
VLQKAKASTTHLSLAAPDESLLASKMNASAEMYQKHPEMFACSFKFKWLPLCCKMVFNQASASALIINSQAPAPTHNILYVCV